MYIIPYSALILAALTQASVACLLKYSSIYKKKLDSKKSIYNFLLIISAVVSAVIALPLMVYGMSKIDLTVSQPIFSVTLFLSTYFFGVIFFKESIIAKQLVGIAVILAGIFLVIVK